LQRLYETILGRALDPRNFQRRVVQVGLVEDSGALRTGLAHRPARLYRFAVRRPVEVEVLT
jgi:8-oxo-dGTP diphosphatase